MNQLNKIMIIIDRPSTYRDIIYGPLIQRIRESEEAEFILVTNKRCKIKEEDLDLLGDIKHYTISLEMHGRGSKCWYLIDKLTQKLMRDLAIKQFPHITLSQTRDHRIKARGGWAFIHMGYASVLYALGLRWNHIQRLIVFWGNYPEFRQLIEVESPAAIVYSNMMLGQMDCLREAKRKGIRLILDLPSWDQATAKGPMTLKPDFVFAWNEEMKSELHEIHGIREDHISITGALYFDSYANIKNLWSREFFCEKYGIDPDSKIIVYSLSRVREDECTLLFIDKIIKAAELIGCPFHLLVRSSPLDDIEDIEDIVAHPKIIVQHPEGVYEKGGKNWMPGRNESVQRMSTIGHADVMLMIQSTMVLDSVFMNRPIINLAYDADLDLPWHLSVKHRFKFTHAQTYQKLGATWMVENDDELLEALKTYLSDPTIHSANRKALSDHAIAIHDGKAYQRWVSEVLSIVQKGRINGYLPVSS